MQRLSLLGSLAVRKSVRVDNATLLARVAEVKDLVSKSCSSQQEILDLMQQQRRASEEQAQKLDEVNQQLAKQDTSSRSILTVAGEALSAIVEVKDLLFQVSQDVINVRIVLDSMFVRSMDPTKELPAIIEDALGRQVPIPPEWLGSLDWEALYTLLSCHFKGQNGHEMVMKRMYTLEESASGRDLDSDRPLHLCLRRGMKINMAMIFQTTEPLSDACPSCMTEIDAPEDITAQCPQSDSRMWFSMRQTVMGDSNRTTSPKDGKLDKEFATTVTTSTPVKPSDFQRVRFFRHDVNATLPDTKLALEPMLWQCPVLVVWFVVVLVAFMHDDSWQFLLLADRGCTARFGSRSHEGDIPPLSFTTGF
ncbi:hypothetical protein CDV36_013203 [Fusarium kuroshium]|uniref:Ubiquitin-like domain-containing protein n=1 Tax=Fusarium kuroshium TaxID=2010991 RepID=A0A3M2RPF7_9HYPO|nr:hypothetical protein CDV36_013203 [Fusarium kuroshium]